MKELKFRIWSEEDKKFYYWGFFKEGDHWTFKSLPGIKLSMQELKERSEQFIGRYDNEGKELYVGDIIKVVCGECGATFIKEIKWDDEDVGYEPFGDYTMCMSRYCDWGLMDPKNILKLGDKHETIELMRMVND